MLTVEQVSMLYTSSVHSYTRHQTSLELQRSSQVPVNYVLDISSCLQCWSLIDV